ncbi:MAG: tetratricopeptide repeat protein [Prevotellaceae bacterium]|jgi:tetratricopeptide (TPR) repeat protein|nr:tetratricopeptide repeat protein [Prevotellaceae bacterium]
MDTNEISKIYNIVNQQLAAQKIAAAFFGINQLVIELKDWNIFVQYEELAGIYSNMLNYKMLGIKEDKQKTVFYHFIDSMFSLAQEIREKLFVKQSSRFEYSQIRTFLANIGACNPLSFAQSPQNLQSHYVDIEVNKLVTGELESEKRQKLFEKHQQVLGYVFHYIWLKTDLENSDFDTISAILSDENIGNDTKYITISALTLNLLRYFDAKKIEFLLNYTQGAPMQLRQRGLVGIALALTKYGYRWHFDEHLKNQFLAFCDKKNIMKELESIVFQIIRTSENEKINKRIVEDIIPEIGKLKQQFKEKYGEKPQKEKEKYDDDDDENPNWQEFFENSGVADKLHELGEMQMNGSDVNIGTFASMKGYPFFYYTENWFMPFSKDNPHFNAFFDKQGSIAALLLNNPAMCNSDKYSFALSLIYLPEKEKAAAKKGFEAQQSQLKEIIEEQKKLSSNPDSKLVANQYIQDLYRFYTLYPRAKEFENPLLEIFKIIHYDIFDKIFKKEETITKIASSFFAYNHYYQALKLYKKIFSTDEPNYEIARKIGYCYQKIDNFKLALQYYTIADSGGKDNTWTLKRMAFCYRQAGEPLLAANCYRRLLELMPENEKLLFREAQCYIEAGKYDDAMPLLFKIDYVNPNFPKIKSVLLWCAFCAGKIEQVAELSQRVLAESPDIQDFIISGGVALAQHKLQTALEYYHKAIALAADIKLFLDLLNADMERLKTLGVQQYDLDLVIETLLMSKVPKHKV